MADNTTWEQDLDAVLGDATDASDETPEDVSLTSERTPGADSQDDATDDQVDETIAAEQVEQSAETESEPEESVAQDAQQATAPNWDSDENPHYREVQEVRAREARAKQLLDTAMERKAAELQLQRIKALSDDDPQRVVEIQQLVADAQKPVVQRSQALEGEIEFAAKLATVTDEAAKAVLTPEEYQRVSQEVERLMALPGGPEHLQRDIANRRADRERYEGERKADKQRIAELERRLAAQTTLKERAANGADHVDSNSGTGLSFQQRWDAASGEEALDVLLADLGVS